MKSYHLDILHQELEELIKNAEELKKREKENPEELNKLKKEHAEELKKRKKENPEELSKLKKEHAEELSKLKKEHTKELFKLVTQVTSLENIVLKRFNYSVLSGEYYAKDASLILKKIENAILLMSFEFIKNSEFIKKDFNRFINYVTDNFTKVINDFRKLIEYTKVKGNNKGFSVSDYDVSHLLNNETDDFTIKQFKINVLLAKLDHDYHSSEEIERKLNRISSYLKRQIKPTHYNNIYDVLKDKVNFLLFKIKRRRDRNTEKPENKYYNSFIEELESIDNDSLTTKKNYHYYHKKSKSYRKEKKEVAISELIIDFQRSKNPKEDDDVFQKLAYQHMDIFLETQEFRTSLSIYKDSLNVEVKINKIKQNFLKIKKEFDNLVNSSKERHHYRFIKEYVLTIDKTFELLLDKFNTRQYAIEEEDIDFIRSLSKILSKSRVIYAKYYKNFIKKKNIHLYLPFEECRHSVRVGKEPINLFIDSSYVLPLNYKEDKIVFNSLVKKIEDKISTIYFKSSELYTKTMETQAKDVVKKAQFNNIQVIAVFAGLITFITSSSVAFMSKDVKITSIAFILLTLIIAFTIFSLLLKILFESSKKERYLFLGVIIAVLFFLHYFHNTNIKQTKPNKEIGSSKDSIKEEAYIRIPSKVTISLEE